MRASDYLRHTILIVLIFASTYAYAQTNNDKLKAKWIVEKFEVEKNTPQAVKAIQNLQGVSLTFVNEELIISKKSETGEIVIKRGGYSVAGNLINLGNDHAEILVLSETSLAIKISGQGVLYLTKNQ
ncbi:MAG: hypothetical protein ABIP79_11415 [Chitinophagaceae bacterium]